MQDWKLKKILIIPVVIVALDTVNDKIETGIKKKSTGIDCQMEPIQKGSRLGTVKIIQKVMNS